MEHEEHDDDPDCCEEDYDLIREPRKLDDRLDELLLSQKMRDGQRGNKCG
jgi:hypothetical protein